MNCQLQPCGRKILSHSNAIKYHPCEQQLPRKSFLSFMNHTRCHPCNCLVATTLATSCSYSCEGHQLPAFVRFPVVIPSVLHSPPNAYLNDESIKSRVAVFMCSLPVKKSALAAFHYSEFVLSKTRNCSPFTPSTIATTSASTASIACSRQRSL